LCQTPEQAVALATECLQPNILTPESMQVVREVNRLVGELDSDDFQTRKKAAEELRKKLSEEAGEPVIQTTLSETLMRGKLSVEVNKAITRLLDEQKEERGWGGARSPELTRMFRSIEILELIHNDAARKVLQKMAAAPPRPEVRREAEAALKRLAAHQSVLVEP
jgi:HEAT repeat protein